MSGLKLKNGGFYINGRGDLYGPMDERTPGHFLDQYGTGYYQDGRQWDHVPASTGNLVRESVNCACGGTFTAENICQKCGGDRPVPQHTVSKEGQ